MLHYYLPWSDIFHFLSELKKKSVFHILVLKNIFSVQQRPAQKLLLLWSLYTAYIFFVVLDLTIIEFMYLIYY